MRPGTPVHSVSSLIAAVIALWSSAALGVAPVSLGSPPLFFEANEGQFPADGSIFVSGRTLLANFQRGPEAVFGMDDVFVSKLSAAGSQLLYTTFYGGSLSEFPLDRGGALFSNAPVDSDGDGLPDALEATTCSDASDADSDEDGLSDDDRSDRGRH